LAQTTREKNRKSFVARDLSANVRDIGEIPSVENPDRREACSRDLKLYLETYHAADFTLGWSPSHLVLIDSVQTAILDSLQQLIAYPRGSGKTQISRRSVQWGALYGHLRFGMLFGAEASKAKHHIRSIKKDFLSNELLLADFPEVVYPIVKAEGIANRANYQSYQGKSTGLMWSGEQICFPDIPQSREAGNAASVIGVGTITGSASRGPLVNGFRPDFCFVDDPQTRKSATSGSQVKERIDIVNGDIMGMAGPDQSISAVMTATVIAKYDLADTLLNRVEHPEWNGISIPMILSWPTDLELWQQWDDIRRMSVVDGRTLQPAHDFYLANRDAMDAGAKVYWEDRIQPGFGSALETAMGLYFRDPVAFASEYQNEPIDQSADESDMPPKDVLKAKTNGHKRFSAPESADRRTAFIDVHGKLLYYSVMAFEADFTGYVYDYGTWPDQGRRYYTLLDSKRTMATLQPKAAYPGQLHFALHALMDQVEKLGIGVGLVDANYGESTDTVYKVCEERKPQSGTQIWFPSHGVGHGATKTPFGEFKTKEQWDSGPNWRVPRQSRRPGLHFLYETNFWKSFVAGHWAIAKGDRGAFTFFEGHHELIVDHLHAEQMTLVKAKDREVGEWSLRQSGMDNHFFDCIVGCCVGASRMKCEEPGLSETKQTKTRERKHITRETIGGR